MTLLETNEELRHYVWSEYEADPIQLIGKTARIEVTYFGEEVRMGRREVRQFIYSGVIRGIVENRGKASVDQADTVEDASDGSAFQQWGRTTIYTDNKRIEFSQTDHAVITVLHRS